MTLDIEEGPGVVSGAFQNIDRRDRSPKVSSPTQFEQTLSMMMDCDEVCSSEFYRAYLPRFSVHVHKARKQGYVITKRPCDRSDHDHHGTQWLYTLEALPRLFDEEGAR